MSELLVGLTGGIGSGKSTVCKYFSELGIDIIDADNIAREVVEPGTPALEQIIERFGAQVLNPEGGLDRAALRHIVFADSHHKQWLNQLLHPIIRQQLLSQSQAAQSAYCILAIPLLIENDLQPLVNKVIVVDLPEAIQLARASDRDGGNQQTIRHIMAAQIDRKSRISEADFIIDNSGERTALPAQVQTLHQKLLAISTQ